MNSDFDWRRRLSRSGFGLLIGGLIALFAALYFWDRVLYTVRSGEEAVLWKRFSGTQINLIFREGTHLIWPWDKLFIYDMRLQSVEHQVLVLSTEGLEIKVDVTIRYHPESKTLPQLHQEVGPEYLMKITVPEVVTAVREVIGRYRPEQLYTIRTEDTQQEIVARASAQARDRFVSIDDVLLRRIELPASIQAAIQRKLNQEQEALEYAYRIDKELREATRKDIEGQGIAFLMKQAGIDIEQLLRWRGVEATLELAKSPNAKTIVIGGREGLPLILNSPTGQ